MSKQFNNDFSYLRQLAGLSIEQLSQQLEYSIRTLYRWERGERQPRQTVLLLLRNIVEARKTLPSPESFKFIDLFAGIGGLRKGFESIGGKCIFTCEWDKYAQQTYKANFPNDSHEISGDITKIKPEEIPEHDVLLAGFPCQPFSIAGVSKKNSLQRPHGFACETQGTLFFDVARIIEHHKPRVFLLENVKNLVNHDKGNTFRIIQKTLRDELGYHIHTKVIDAKSWVPQHRERIFIAGFRDTQDFSFNNLSIPDPLNGPKLKTILHPEDGTEPEDSPFTKGSNGQVAEKYLLSNHLWKYLQDYAEKHRLKGNGFGFGLVGPENVTRTLSARYYKDGSEILISRGKDNPRRLTPRECARLMGFEKPGCTDFVIPVSDTQAYRQFGNSVVVPVVEAVARYMAPWITGEKSITENSTSKNIPSEEEPLVMND
jgi:DNA (cytosine-5)-methyltransferase 1